MSEPGSDKDLRPELAFRVGVTGHRELKGVEDRLLVAVEACFATIGAELERLANEPSAQRAYRRVGGGPFELKAVSPLAAGADRLVAAAGLDAGATLYAPLPFEPDAYELDAPGAVGPFRELLGRAEVFVLDGLCDGGHGQDESYAAVGRYVVRNCDLLIAIWDGERERGYGGSGEIVSFATRVGVPVWWIPLSGLAPAKLLRSVADFYALANAPAGQAANLGLREFLARAVLPPQSGAPERDGPLGRIAERWRAARGGDRSPLEEFFDETPPPPRALWRAYRAFFDFVAPAKHLPPRNREPRDAWAAGYAAADLASNAYGDRYRSSYVLIKLLAVIALSSAAVAADAERARPCSRAPRWRADSGDCRRRRRHRAFPSIWRAGCWRGSRIRRRRAASASRRGPA